MAKMSKKQSKQLVLDEMNNSIKRDAILKKDLQLLYMFSMDSIDKEIKAFLKRYEEKGINISELRKRATNEEISELNRRIEKYIRQKELTSGEKLQVDVFNALSKLTRLELLQYHIDLAMLELSDSERELSEKFLNQEYTKGLELSAKTMGIDVLSAGQLALAMKMIVREDFKGQTWSQRLWKNQKALRERVSVIVADSLLRGKNPKGFASAIQKEFNVSRHAVTRLLITEGTRVNANVQVESMKANGYEYFEIVPEPSACDFCKPLANKPVRNDEALSGVTIPPFHPHCKCGLVASAGDEMKENKNPPHITSMILDSNIKTLQLYEEYSSRRQRLSVSQYIPEEEALQISNKIHDILDKSTYSMRFDFKNIDKLLKSQRFLNQFETNTSNGAVGKTAKMYRKQATGNLFGANVKKLKRKDFEKYGYFGDIDAFSDYKFNQSYHAGVNQYGDVIIRFNKNKMQDRTTFTINNSLGPSVKEELIADNPMVPKLVGIEKEKIFDYSTKILDNEINTVNQLVELLGVRYIEAQYHGNVLLNDVNEIYFTKNMPNETQIEQLKKFGIKLFKLGDDNFAEIE